MYEVDPAFAPDNLVKGRLYEFKARNFFKGVWDGEKGFIGIREKFYSIYLFTEWHADPPFSGTVWNIRDGGEQVPDDIEVRERFDVRCRSCEQPVEFLPDVPGTRVPGRQYHLDSALDADHDPHGQAYSPPNTALLLWLAQFEEDERYRDFIVAITHETNQDKVEELTDAYIKHRYKRRESD